MATHGHRLDSSSSVVEGECPGGDRVPGVGAGRGLAGGCGEPIPGGGIGGQLRERRRQGGGVVGGHQPGRARGGDLREAADSTEHEWLAEGEAGVEDPGVLGVAVGKDDEVGAAEDRRDLGVIDEAGDEADAARRLGGEATQRLDVHAGVADDPELRPLQLAEGRQQRVESLVGAQQAEEEDHRALGALQLRRQRLLLGKVGQVVEGAVGDDTDPGGVDPDLVAQAGRAVLGMGDDGVHAAEAAACARHLPATGARGQDVVGGHHTGTAGREQAGVESGHGQPLVVDDVGVDLTAQAQHVGQVLGGLEGAAARCAEAARCAAPVEALADTVAVGVGNGAVEEPAGQQLDLGSRSRQRRREGAVVGRRECRGIYELNLHARRGVRCPLNSGRRLS